MNALEELGEDEEDVKRKDEQREVLARFQQNLIDQMTSAIEAMNSRSTNSSSSKRPTNLNNFDSSVETATATRTTMTMTNRRKNGNDDD